MTRSVLITGAGGFVGAHLAQGFLAMGATVTAFDIAFDAPTIARLSGATLVETALTKEALAGLPRAALVIHGAAITTPAEAFGLTEAQHLERNIDLLNDTLAHAVGSGASDFVFLSSSGVFGPEDSAGVHLETTPATSVAGYAQAKRAGELATAAANNQAIRAISLRLGPVYGPHEVARSTRNVVSQVRRWLDRALCGEPIVVDVPEESRDWTFAPDLAEAIDAVLAQEPRLTGVVHLTSADIISNLELAQAIAALIDGAEVLVRPSGAPARLPMASVRLDMPSLLSWTALPTGLSLTLAAESAR